MDMFPDRIYSSACAAYGISWQLEYTNEYFSTYSSFESKALVDASNQSILSSSTSDGSDDSDDSVTSDSNDMLSILYTLQSAIVLVRYLLIFVLL
jgi:hypothetical protein